MDDLPLNHHPAWFDLTPSDPPLTEPLDALRSMEAQLDVAVIGLGASGLEAMVELAEQGVRVVGLDAVGVAAGAAGANGGFLLAGLASFHDEAIERHGRAAAVAWYWRTMDELDRLAATEPSFERVGTLRLAHDEAEQASIASHLAALQRDNLPGEPYDGTHGVGILVPTDGRFDPVARCRRLAGEAIAAGATLVAPARVVGIESDGTVRVEGLAVPLRPRAVLVCVDGGLERLLPQLAPDVRTARLQMLATAPDRSVRIEQPLYVRHGLDYIQQLPTGEVLVGGGRDLDGDAWTAPAEPSATVQQHLDRLLAARGITAAVTHRWSAHAAFTDDRLPINVRIHPTVHVVGAYSGHGNVLGGLLAREAARALL